MTSADPAERRLIQLLCAIEARRQPCIAEISHLIDEVNPARLIGLLKQVNLLVLLGQRLLSTGLGEVPELRRELESYAPHARRWGVATELLGLEVLDQLAAKGIRALVLKGSMLARELYGDVGARSSVDVDVLVSPADLASAVTVVAEMGWRLIADVRRAGGLPALHERLVHPALPAIELHWRVHWYERQFAVDALMRAETVATGEPLRMQPLDGLIALMLFYARDGFSGLRYPTDVAAWWDHRCVGAGVPSPLQFVTERYPPLAAPVGVASGVLFGLVGLPVEALRAPPFRWRLAAGLTSPFLDGGRRQAEANAALADVLLAPPHTVGDALRRVLQNAPVEPPRPGSTVGAGTAATVGHGVRVLRRWVLALAHGYRPRRRAG